MRPSLLSAVFALLLPLLPWGLSAQESSPGFLSIGDNLEQLERLIEDTLNSNETLMLQLADLSQVLNEREQLIGEQEALLTGLESRLHEMSETYKTLSSLSKKYEASSKFWRTFTIIGIPAAMLISGLTTGLVMSAR
jgi:hypothetical protein